MKGFLRKYVVYQKRFRKLLLGVFFLAMPSIMPAQLPTNFQQETVVSGLNQPIAMAFLPDGRLMIGQRNGLILISSNPQPESPPVNFQTVLALPNVNTGGERGVTNLLLDPQFSTNGHLYIFYTQDVVDQSRVSRFTYDPITRTVSSQTEMILWEDTTGFPGCCHYGGAMGFLEDGSLLIAIGDQFDASRAQDLTSPAGKIHRINPSLPWYNGTQPGNNIPVDNPLYDGSSGQFNSEGAIQSLFGIGLRNPFTGYNDRSESNWKLYIAEVGGNDHARAFEDIHLARLSDIAGGQVINFGWPACGDGAGGVSGGTSGTGRDPATGECINDGGLYADPIFAYPHNGGQAIIMGFANHGSQLPTVYENVLFYCDYTRDFIKYVSLDSNGLVPDYPGSTPPGSPSVFAQGTDEIVKMIQGPDGSVYWASLQRNTNLGYIKRIKYTGGLSPVIENFEALPLTSTSAPLEVSFQFSAMDSDTSQAQLSYTLLFGDGSQQAGSVHNIQFPVQHTYTSKGIFTATLRISDGIYTTSEELIISIGTSPEVQIVTPGQGDLFVANQLITYSGTHSAAAEEEWFIELSNQGTLQPRFTGNGSSGNFTTVGSAENHVDFSFEKWYRITYRVTDANGLSTEKFVEIFPDEVHTTFTSNIPEIVINIDGEPRPAPYTFDDVIGFDHEISAPPNACINGVKYNFVNWSDGGPLTHIISIPETNQTFTAHYVAAGSCDFPEINGMVLRYKGDQGVTATQGMVTQWTNQAGPGNDLIPVSGSPALIPGLLNGHDVIRFDGLDDALGNNSFSGLPLGSGPRSVFMMVKYATAKYGGFTYGTTAVNRVFGLVTAAPTCNAIRGTLAVEGWGCPNISFSQEQALGQGWLSHSAVFDGSNVRHYRDGQNIGNKEQVYNTTQGKIRMAVQHDDSGFAGMDIAELVMFNREISEPERQQIESYFREEYFGGTSEPNASLSLRVNLQGRNNPSGTYTLELYALGSTSPGYSFNVPVNAGGILAVQGIQPGNYTLALKHPQFLRHSEVKQVSGGVNDFVIQALPAGDANNDNRVTALDFSILATSYNLSAGQTGYDVRADFNGDGTVTQIDYSLLTANFNNAGSVPGGL